MGAIMEKVIPHLSPRSRIDVKDKIAVSAEKNRDLKACRPTQDGISEARTKTWFIARIWCHSALLFREVGAMNEQTRKIHKGFVLMSWCNLANFLWKIHVIITMHWVNRSKISHAICLHAVKCVTSSNWCNSTLPVAGCVLLVRHLTYGNDGVKWGEAS